MSTLLRADRTTASVRRDRWDEADLELAKEHLPALAAAGEDLDGRTEYADDLIADVHASFLRPRVELNDRVDPTRAVHRAVMAEAVEVDVFKALKEHTIDDPLTAGMATTAFVKHLAPLFEKLGDVTEKATAAKAKLDEYEDVLERLGDGTADPATEELLQELEGDLATAEAELDDAIAGAGPQIGRAVRTAVREANEKAEAIAADIRSWGGDPGEFTRMDPDTRIRLAQRMATPEMRRIAEMFGRLYFSLKAVAQNDWTDGPAEVCSIKLGNDLGQVIPSEFVYLAIPELAVEFYRKYAARQLQCYQLRERTKTARGPIVYVLDCSDSMGWNGGKRLTFGVGLGLALLGCARDQGRACRLITFHGPNTWETFDFPKPAEFEPERMLNFASVAASGGTDFMGPLSEAAELCTADHAATHLTGADIVFVTDGEARVTDAWLAGFTAARAAAGFRVWGVSVEQTVPPILDDICELTATVRDLFAGGDVSQIFTAVAKSYV